MPRALKKTAKSAKSVKTAKTARRVIKPWTKEDVRMLKAHSKARTRNCSPYFGVMGAAN